MSRDLPTRIASPRCGTYHDLWDVSPNRGRQLVQKPNVNIRNVSELTPLGQGWPPDLAAPMLAAYQDRRDYLMARISRMERLDANRPDGAFYYFTRYASALPANVVLERLLAGGVAVRSGAEFGPRIRGDVGWPDVARRYPALLRSASSSRTACTPHTPFATCVIRRSTTVLANASASLRVTANSPSIQVSIASSAAADALLRSRSKPKVIRLLGVF